LIFLLLPFATAFSMYSGLLVVVATLTSSMAAAAAAAAAQQTGAENVATTDANNNKDFKICNVLGGLDVTRFVATRAKGFFAMAIDDVELSREFLAESLISRETYGDFPTLEAMSETLDYTSRGLPEGTTTVDAGIGYSDDREDRRIERFMSLVDAPLVGDKKADFDMIDTFTLLFPWLVDRQAKEGLWHVEHINGQNQGGNREPFTFDSLYTAAWSVTWGGGCTYYPPLQQYGVTMGDVIGGTYSLREELYVVPFLPENNPERHAFFTKPYPDTAVPGLSLITAGAPIYFTGYYHNYTYQDTYIGTVGVDIAVASVSSYLNVLQDTLAKGSFGILVDNDFSTIVISEEVVRLLYPERTGFEESRVAYSGIDGTTIVEDRRNQTYLPSDTIHQGLTELKNANWEGLLKSVRNTARGSRGFDVINITLTGHETPTEYYAMFDRWEYVAEWNLLVFVPKIEIENAIDVAVNLGQDNEVVPMAGEKGEIITNSVTIKNNGNLDVLITIEDIPSWTKLSQNMEEAVAFSLSPGATKNIPFEILTGELEVGTQTSVMVFGVQDEDYPDCFYSESRSVSLSIVVTSRECSKANFVANDRGDCVCSSSSVDIFGICVAYGPLVGIVMTVLFSLAVAFFLYLYHKRKHSDTASLVKIDSSELRYDSPPQVLGEGKFGRVLLSEYRGTQVAVKQLVFNDAAGKLPSTAMKTSDSKSKKKKRKALLHEIQLLSRLRHPCILALFGFVVEKKKEVMIVMEYMEHGSLHDLIHNETMDFDGDVMLAFLRDIVTGIQFLHNTKPQVVHGNLKSHNVLIDSRLRAKVADYSLSVVMKAKSGESLYWKAPELLNGEVESTASDVYALGMILWELYSRKDPYQDEDSMIVLSEIRNSSICRRPSLPKTMPASVSAIMHDCFLESAPQRPSIDEIASRIKRFKPEGVEPIGLVKKKAGGKDFDVLLKVFPRHVAEALRDGRKVDPEHHDCVTIFFSGRFRLIVCVSLLSRSQCGTSANRSLFKILV
jgi:tRNA A-37 threonylcarbamoyl transferase component Bud32